MTDLCRIGTTHEPDDDIEDAEFLEVDDVPPTPPAQPTKRRNRSGCLSAFIAIVGGVALWVGTVATLRELGLWRGSKAPSAASDIETQQMLAEFSRQVTGSVSDAGLTLTDGAGPPGEKCDERAKQILRFGGFRQGNIKGQILYDAFLLGIIADGTTIQGVFWFDPAASTITISNSQMFDLEDNPKRSLPDATVPLRPPGDGTLEFRGTKFHVCEAPK